MSSQEILSDRVENAERNLWRYRQMIGLYRKFMASMQIDHVLIERVLLGAEESNSTYKTKTLAHLRVWLDREGLKAAGFSEPAIRECAEWLRELSVADQTMQGRGHD
jgi:hypothetical protein